MAIAWILASCIAASTAGRTTASESEGPDLRVVVDARIELCCVIFRLAEFGEYVRGRIPAYCEAVDDHFGDLRDHPVVAFAQEQRRTRGVGYDACMSIAIHLPPLDDLLDAEEAPSFEPRPASLDGRWSSANAQRFAELARDFARESEFVFFLEDQEALHELAVERLNAMLEVGAHLEWFDAFFGVKAGARFTLALGLLNGPGNYGPRVRGADGTEELFCVLGVWNVDDDGDPVFQPGMRATIAHEFCHSYANPLVDANLDGLRAAGEVLFPKVAETMRQQAYGNWQTMMRESLVRAATIRYLRATQGEEAAAAASMSDYSRGFLWIAPLTDLLDGYEADRELYPTLGEFFPHVVAFFDRFAADAG